MSCKAVSAYFTIKQILPFDFAEQYCGCSQTSQQTQSICIKFYNIGPTSLTLVQHFTNVLQMFIVCRDDGIVSRSSICWLDAGNIMSASPCTSSYIYSADQYHVVLVFQAYPYHPHDPWTPLRKILLRNTSLSKTNPGCYTPENRHCDHEKQNE